MFSRFKFFNSSLKNLNIKILFCQETLGKTWVLYKIYVSPFKKINLFLYLKKFFKKFGVMIYSPWNKKPMHLPQNF